MGKFVDLTSIRVGRLTVLHRGKNIAKQPSWVCLCDCGNETQVVASSLKSARTRSCGCLRTEVTKKTMTTHGLTNSPEYGIWSAMKKRCYDTNNQDYKNYGGRGITVCDRWVNSFANFYADLGAKPNAYSLDRIDVNGNYEPSNCKWSSLEKQANNKTTSAFYTLNGETNTIAQWARKMNIKPTLLRKRLCNGMDISKAIVNTDHRRSINV
jgi:hypothetical protein